MGEELTCNTIWPATSIVLLAQLCRKQLSLVGLGTMSLHDPLSVLCRKVMQSTNHGAISAMPDISCRQAIVHKQPLRPSRSCHRVHLSLSVIAYCVGNVEYLSLKSQSDCAVPSSCTARQSIKPTTDRRVEGISVPVTHCQLYHEDSAEPQHPVGSGIDLESQLAEVLTPKRDRKTSVQVQDSQYPGRPRFP